MFIQRDDVKIYIYISLLEFIYMNSKLTKTNAVLSVCHACNVRCDLNSTCTTRKSGEKQLQRKITSFRKSLFLQPDSDRGVPLRVEWL